jgi:hypothetical protein
LIEEKSRDVNHLQKKAEILEKSERGEQSVLKSSVNLCKKEEFSKS